MAQRNQSQKLSTRLQMLQSYKSQQATSKRPDYSKSRDPHFPSIAKQDDVTRYNSLTHRVAFYKNYPNRCGTPIKTEREKCKPSFRKSIPARTQKLNELFRKSAGDWSVDKQLYKTALNANLRLGMALPSQTQHFTTGPGYVMNDFHIKETNPGFARNALGGFYTK